MLPGAGPSLEGYFYQLDVSVLFALDLLLAKKVAHSVQLEPATQEDLELDIEDEPQAATEVIRQPNYNLIVQCKYRTTDPWKEAEIVRLLAHGKRRIPAKDRLTASAATRYLLVTSADLDGVVRALRISTIGDWPSEPLPARLRAELPTDAAGRVAVLSSLDQEKLDSRIEKLLTQRFRVPFQMLSKCKELLRAQAIRRMRGEAGGVWARHEMETIIGHCDGYAGAAEALEGFVEPTNWQSFRSALDLNNAVIITGASGTGKTRVAQALIASLKDAVPGIDHQIIQGGPERIQSYTSTAPVVFEIEDPWGKFRLEPNSVPWNDSIRDVLHSAGKNRRFIITSRSDVYRAGHVPQLSKKWFVELQQENYGPDERALLFNNQLKTLPTKDQVSMVRCEKEVIDLLMTPLEMHRYFSVIRDGPDAGESEEEFLRRCLSEAQQESIETALLRHIESQSAWNWAAIIWGLFKALRQVSFTVLPQIQAGLASIDTSLEDGLGDYANFLIAGRNLRQIEATLTYYHPRVEQGLQQAVLKKPDISRRMFRHLTDVLLDLDAPGSDWGAECTSRLLRGVKEIELDLSLLPSQQTQVDEWLDHRVAGAGPHFSDDLRLAAAIGSEKSVAAEIGRWLEVLPKKKGGGLSWLMRNWSEPDRSADWYAWLSASPKTAAILSVFIKRQLGNRSTEFPRDFSDKLRKFGADQTPAFIEAALSISSQGYNPNAPAIAEGALADVASFESVIQASSIFLRGLEADGGPLTWLGIVNGEYDDASVEHHSESGAEEGDTAENFLKWYTAKRRKAEGWPAIRAHLYLESLLPAWIEIAANDPGALHDEWRAIVDAVRDQRIEWKLWKEVKGHFPSALLEDLRSRLKIGIPDRKTRVQSIETAIVDTPDLLKDVLAHLVSTGNAQRVAEFFIDFSRVASELRRHSVPIDPLAGLADDLKNLLPATTREVAELILRERDVPLSSRAQHLLLSLEASRNIELKYWQAKIAVADQQDPERLLHEIFAFVENDYVTLEIATESVELVRRATLWDLMERLLRHRFADVRQKAMEALAERSPGALPPALLALSSDEGNRVREALLELIRKSPGQHNVKSLLKLAADTWTPSAVHYGEDPDYPIAEAAARLLLDTCSLDDELISEVVRIIETSEDSGIRFLLASALVRNGTERARRCVIEYAVGSGKPPLHFLAAAALTNERNAVSPALLDGIETDEPVRKPASTALQLTYLFGFIGNPEKCKALGQLLAQTPARRALLVPMTFALLQRDRALAMHAMNLLPQELTERLESIASGKELFLPGELDGLGDAAVIDVIQEDLAEFFPKSSSGGGDTAMVDLA